jgi:uncharacterized protein YndB with AHSA1/START domain/pimeloyl-ACP methyl ester carboxylesterase
MTQTHNPVAKAAPHEVSITRIFNAPRELVFDVWTKPHHVAQWWGPHGFSAPVCELDVRPGGAMLIHMQGPDGTIYPGKGVFEEVVPPERLVFTDSAFDDETGTPQLIVRNIVTFEEYDGKTRMNFQAIVIKSTPEVEEALAGMEQGWQESFDRLNATLVQGGMVISKDGTRIAFEQAGSGPALILVASAMSDRSDTKALAALLAAHFTVINYDRRGRGDSGDTLPYAVQREIEDIEALIDHAGGSAFIFGSSSGAVLTLEAAAHLPTKISKATLFEPPFVLDDSRPPVPADFVQQIRELIEANRRSDAVEYFFTQAVGVPAEFVAGMKAAPSWAAMEKTAHTLVYDGILMGDTQAGKPLPAQRWNTAVAPTLVMVGGESPAWFHNAAQSLVDILPNAQHRILAGEHHGSVVMSPQAFVPVILDFLTR